MDYQDLVKFLANQVIKETMATMMDVQPIIVVGQEHPAKKYKKEEISETSKVTDYDAYKGRKQAVNDAQGKLDEIRKGLTDKYKTDDPSTVRKVTSDRTKLETNFRKQDYYDKKKKLDKNVELFKKKYGHHPERTEEITFSKFYDEPHVDKNHDDPKDKEKALEKSYKSKAYTDELHKRVRQAKKKCKENQ